MTLTLLLAGIAALIMMDVPQLVNKRQWGELTVFSVLLTAGVTLMLLQHFGVNVPSPIKGIEYFLKEVLKLSYH